jgi:glycosyltransferase involved in cell wall biosynthesis
MKILFITRLYHPHLGGVEKHTGEISKELIKKGHSVTILTGKYDRNLKNEEVIDKVKVVRFSYPQVKLLGLLAIWVSIYQNRKLIENADVIHCHDVFIWYLPFRFFYPKKRVYVTFHGWEGIWPIPTKNILIRRLSARLAKGVIAVAKGTAKYYGIKPDKIIYGATNKISNIDYRSKKDKYKIVFVGRLNKDSGLLKFFAWLGKHKKYRVDFVGDGDMRNQCKKYGVVHGYTESSPFMKEAGICVPGGYLSFIEAKKYGCEIMTFPTTKIMKGFWSEIEKVKKFPTWEELTDEYLNLYNHI